MRKLLEPYRNYSDAFIDDVSVFSQEWHLHLKHLNNVFQAFSDAKMTLRLSKCMFAKPEINFIGHKIGDGKRSPILNKVETIKAIPIPHTKTLLKKFLGMIGFYRPYIEKFADIAHPLTELLKKDQPNVLRFEGKHSLAFQTLKDRLFAMTELYKPDFTNPFILHTDASKHSTSACLSQLDKDNNELSYRRNSIILKGVYRQLN